MPWFTFFYVLFCCELLFYAISFKGDDIKDLPPYISDEIFNEFYL